MNSYVLLIGCGTLAATPLLAQTTPARAPAPAPDAAAPVPDEGGDGTVIVTATRRPAPADQVAVSATVLDKATIDRAGDLSVADLLLRTPGVSLSRNGGYGTATSLRIRGAEPDQTVVVIDGVKLNDPSSAGGGYNFANLLVGDASRIEVLRGPQSVLWGSQAIGGVVNVVTPLPTTALEGSFDIEAGSRETVSGRAAFGGRTGPLAWRIAGQTFATDGISAIAPAFGGRERDGYTNRSLAGRALLELGGDVSAELRGYHARSRTEFDATTGDTPEYTDNREFVGYAGLNAALLDGRWRNRFGYAYTDTDRDNFNPARARARTFDAAGRNQRWEYQGSIAVARGIDAIVGAERERSRFRSVSPSANPATPIPAPARGRAGLTSFYGQLAATPLAGLTLTGGVRHDDHSRFGGQTLGEGNAIWSLPSGTILRAAYAEGFKGPTLFQLFSDFGNQALAPERAKGWEAGVEQRLFGARAAVGATYFERRSRDLIIFAGCPAVTTNPLCFAPGSGARRSGYYDNVSRAFARGIEAAGRIAPTRALTLAGNYSWTVSEDRSAGVVNRGRQLPRRPRHAWNLSADYAVADRVSFGAAVRRAGGSFDTATTATRLAPYTLVDLRGELPLTAQVRLFARVENVFDDDYQTAFRYNTLGRSVYAGLRGRF